MIDCVYFDEKTETCNCKPRLDGGLFSKGTEVKQCKVLFLGNCYYQKMKDKVKK